MIDSDQLRLLTAGSVSSPPERARKPTFAFKSARDDAPKTLKPRSTSDSRARLSLILLLYFLSVIAVIALAPFTFRFPHSLRVLGTSDWFDAGGNVLLFIPIGFLYPLSRRGENPSPLHVLLAGAMLGSAIETAHLFEIDRYLSPIAIAANAAGAGIGALLLGVVNRRIRLSARLAGRLSLEIPLMGLIYLLIPLLLVASFSATDDSFALLTVLSLGFLGARLISAVQEYHFGPAGVFRHRDIAIVAGGWTALGIFPIGFRHPLVGVGLVLVVALTTMLESSRPTFHAAERRFEADVLRSAKPYVAVYFLAFILFPFARGFAPWHFAFGLTGSDGDRARQMMRLLEPVAALTVLGYMLAEARGRRELPFRKVAARVVVECTVVALAIEASRGVQRETGASGAGLLIMIGAALLGAGIYHQQRERIRWILIHGAPQPKPITPSRFNVW